MANGVARGGLAKARIEKPAWRFLAAGSQFWIIQFRHLAKFRTDVKAAFLILVALTGL